MSTFEHTQIYRVNVFTLKLTRFQESECNNVVSFKIYMHSTFFFMDDKSYLKLPLRSMAENC
jgi:hypothetical protein